MRTPKAPAGFVPVDQIRISEPYETLNYYYLNEMGIWRCSWDTYEAVKAYAELHPERHYHVQLPPPVEWEEVWGWGEDESSVYFTKNGVRRNKQFTKEQMDAMTRALNEMEGQNG